MINDTLINDILITATSITGTSVNLRTFIDHSPLPTILVDPSGQIEEWNSATEKTFGWSFTECEKSIVNHALPEHRKMLQLLLECAGKGEALYNIDIGWLHKNGKSLAVLLTLAPIRNSQQKVVAIYAICMDITTQRATEKALQQAKNEAERANRIQSDFLANISHEIRTPLSTIIGLADILNGTTLDDRQRNWLTTLQNSSEHLLALINDLFDYANIDAGKFQLETTAFSLHQLIDSLQLDLQPLIDQKQLNLNIELPAHHSAQITGDPLRLKQVLFNLLQNAINFTATNGFIALRIFNTSSHKKKDTIRLDFEVSDTGIGMDKDTLDQLFIPFFQADRSTSQQIGNTGLGLAISQQLVHLMGGKISVVSTPGEGSVFRFRLSFRAIDEKPMIAHAEPESNPTLLHSRLILVAEDFLPNQEVIEFQLRSLGCEVHIANDGVEAIAMAKARRYDTILMDIRMPNMDGLEATRQIRLNEDPSLTPIPIIAVTADVQPRERQRCFEAGMNDYLSKPVSKKMLGDKLHYWLQNRPPTRNPAQSTLKPSDETILDRFPEAVEQLLKDLPPKSTLTVLQTALKQTSPQIGMLLEALKDRNWTAAEVIAHRLKGTSRYYAEERFNQLLTRVSALSTDDLETSIDTLSIDTLIDGLIEDLTIEYTRIQQQLQQAISKLQNLLARQV